MIKKIFFTIFFLFLLCVKGFGESYYFKKCDLSKEHIADYLIDFDNKIIDVSFLIKKDGTTQVWQDKIDTIKKDQVASEKIQSKGGKDYYFQYYLDSKLKSVTRQNYKKVGDFFVLYGPPMKGNCEDVKADWDKSVSKLDQLQEERIKQLEDENRKKIIEKKKKQKELTLKEEERRKKLKKENKEKNKIYNISIVTKKWIKLSKYNADSTQKLKNDFDKKAQEICENKKFSIIEKKVEIIEMDETPAFGTETVIKLGIVGNIECKN